MYQMLRYPAPGALTFVIYQETHTATMTCGSKCNISLLHTMLCFDDCSAWTVLVQTYANILGGCEPPYPSPKYGFGLQKKTSADICRYNKVQAQKRKQKAEAVGYFDFD